MKQITTTSKHFYWKRSLVHFVVDLVVHLTVLPSPSESLIRSTHENKVLRFEAWLQSWSFRAFRKFGVLDSLSTCCSHANTYDICHVFNYRCAIRFFQGPHDEQRVAVRYAGVIWFVFSNSPSSVVQIFDYKFVLHYQMYDETSTKTILKIGPSVI